MVRRLLILLLLFAGVAIAGGIYTWVDEQAQQELEKRRQERQRREQPQKVLGTVVLGFAPTVLATLPKPPIALTVVIRSLAGGSEIKIKVADPSPQWKVEKDNVAASYQNVSFSLLPGSYEIAALEVKAQSLSDSPFSLLTGGPRFAVPEENCVYIGRIAFIYMRLPPGSLAQAQTTVGTMARERGKPVMFVYLPKGALVGASTAVDTPDDAREKSCAIQLAKF